MSDLSLGSNDYLAIAKALDRNNNNRIDNSEANVSQRANMMIGNSNNVNGVREVANSLERGDIVLTGLSQDSSDNIATYFSDRANNQNLHSSQWKNDGWVSKADLTMSDRARKLIDVNGDNRISTREFSDALRTGKVSIGNNSVTENPVSTNPFNTTTPTNTNSTSTDPFAKPINNTKPSTSTDPFGNTNPTPAPVNNNSSNPFNTKPTNSTTSSTSSDPFGKSKTTNNQSSTNSSDPFGAKPVTTNKPVNSSDPFSKH